MNARFNQMNARFNQMDSRFGNLEARLVNASATETEDLIRPLTDGAGAQPPGVFPNTYGALVTLSNNDTLTLLQFYQIPVNPRATRLLRLRKYLNVRV
jgi:Protein of unknown function (DUF3294)